MSGNYPTYTPNPQDTRCDIPGRTDIANASDYNDHDRQILEHQGVLVEHEGRVVVLENNLGSLGKVDVVLPASGQALIYNGSVWKNELSGSPIYRGTFTNADLVNGVLLLGHGLDLSAPYGVFLMIYSNSRAKIDPDDIICHAHQVEVHLESWGVISGTWGYVYG